MSTNPPTSFLYLEDAAHMPGCLLCALISSHVRRSIEFLLWERVNDPCFRAEWRAAVGFCHRHAWMLAERQDEFGTAILYLDLYKSYGEGLTVRRPGDSCSLCNEEAATFKFVLQEMQRRWDEPAFATAIRECDGLCLPHLRMVRRRLQVSGRRGCLPREILNALTDATLRTLRQLPGDLHQLIESFDYQHTRATDLRIKLSWRRAIEQLAGSRYAPAPE